MMANQYARLIFDRELHDRLLQEVLAADVQAPGLTLMNTVAQERPNSTDSADDYFYSNPRGKVAIANHCP